MTTFPGLEWASDDLEFKASSGQFSVDEAQGIVECFVAAVGNKDSVGDVVAPGAFDGSLRRRKPRVVWGHDWNQPIGKVIAIEEVGPNDPRLPMKMKQAGVGGLLARVQFNLRSERGKEAFASVAFFGDDQEWSIGYKTIRAEYDPGAQANVLQEVELFEVSPVLHGANQLTGTISVKSADEDRIDSFQKSKWPMFDRSYAANLKETHPDIWRAGGNIKGNDQYEILSKIAQQGGKATTEDQIKALELREAWIARHHADFRLPGIVAQIKWLAIGSRGEDHMKKVIADKTKAKSQRMGSKGYEHGADEHGAMEMPMRRRVMMALSPDGRGLVRAGREEYGFRQNDDDGVYVQKNPGLGAALAATMRSPIELQMVRDNFAIFSTDTEYGETEDFFVSYHYDRENNRYMFSEPFEVDVEVQVNFESEHENMNDYKSYASDWDDIDVKRIGTAIGGGGGNADDTVDHDGDGLIFDGTPNQQRVQRRRQQDNAPMRREVTQGGQTYRVTDQGRRAGGVYRSGQGPQGPAGPQARNQRQMANVQARARLQQMRRDINQQGSSPGGERRAGQRMQDVGRYLQAAERNDQARRNVGRGVRQSPQDQARVARERLRNRRAEINRTGSSPGGERRVGEQMRQVGAYLRAAEANDQARNGRPAPAQGPMGPEGRPTNRAAAARRRREAVRKLQERRRQINQRGSMPGGERRAGQQMRDTGRYLNAAAENEFQRGVIAADRSSGPAGPRGPGANYGSSRSDSRDDRYEGNAARMSNGFQQRYVDRNGKFSNVRTPFKSYQDIDALYDPAASAWDVDF